MTIRKMENLMIILPYIQGIPSMRLVLNLKKKFGKELMMNFSIK